MKKTCGVYKLTSPNGKIYIGQSVFIESRMSQHRKRTINQQQKLYSSFKEFGFDNHKLEILKECKPQDLYKWEKYYINFYDTFDTDHGLNLQRGGKDSSNPAQVTKDRMSISQKKRFLTHIHPNKGVPMSEDQKEKLRIANLGKKASLETRRKMSISSSGKTRTPEHQEKLSAQRRGKPPRQVKCKYCGTSISFLLVNRWHNENCKNKQK